MSRKSVLLPVVCAMVCLVAGSGLVGAADVSEDFGTVPCTKVLAAPDWFGQPGVPAPNSGFVTVDPLDASNCVMSFRALGSGGDAFTKLVAGVPGMTYVVEFDYLGDPTRGGIAANLGGTVGISDGFPGGHRWPAGTSLGGGIETDLFVDDGVWHHYSILFDPFLATGCCGYNGLGSFHVMFEDFVGSGGVAGDVFFDNISVHIIDGACCANGPGTDSDCVTATQDDCESSGGLYLGDQTECTMDLNCTELAVTLESISATQVRGGVSIRWTTASEVDTLGFRVLREVPGGREKAAKPISSLIHASGSGLTGASYEFLDNSRPDATVIHYYLEDIDLSGKVTRHGPVRLEIGGAPATRTDLRNRSLPGR